MNSLEYFLNPNHNNDILYSSELLTIYQRTVSLNLILISFKVLKYLGALIERVTVMFKVLHHAQSDILYFFALYLIIFISFTTTFHIFYGSQVERFSTYGDSFNTLFLYLGRNILQIEEMKDMSFNFTAVYFIIFITSMEFILMNMFIAIIALSYSTVNKQLKGTEKDSVKVLEKKHIVVRLQEAWRSFISFNWYRNRKESAKRRYEGVKRKWFSKRDQGQNKETNQEIELEESPEVDRNIQEAKENAKATIRRSKKAIQLHEIEPEIEGSSVDRHFKEESKEDVEAENKKSKSRQTNAEGSTKNKQYSSMEPSVENSSSSEDPSESINKEDKHDTTKDQKKLDEIMGKDAQELITKRFVMEDEFQDENLQSEKQAYDRQVERERKLGYDLWSLIGYIVFFSIFSYLVFAHVRVSMFNMYNAALKNTIEGETIQSGSDYINITDVATYEDITTWLVEGLPNVFEEDSITDDNRKYFFVNTYNFVLERRVRICFRLAQENPNPDEHGGPIDMEWSRDHDTFEDSGSLYKETFTGDVSGTTYEYIEHGFRDKGSYCFTQKVEDITADDTIMRDFMNDHIISNQMFFLSLEFVTYEASNYFYTYNAILIEIENNGDVSTSLDIASLDVRKYNEWFDWIRLVFEIIFIFIVIYLIYNFISKTIKKLRRYGQWEQHEIKCLPKVILQQRHQYEPEIVRKFWTVVDFFTIFEVIFYILVFIIVIMWLVFIIKYQILTENYHDYNRNEMYINFYNGKELFDVYKIMLSLASICISFNLLSHMFMLNHCLADSKMEILYFLIFYIILILGFVSVAYLTFGPFIKEYHTFGDAMVE